MTEQDNPLEIYRSVDEKGSDGVWRVDHHRLRRTYPLPEGPAHSREESEVIKKSADYTAGSYFGRGWNEQDLGESGYSVDIKTGPQTGKVLDIVLDKGALPDDELGYDMAHKRELRLAAEVQKRTGRRGGRFVILG